MNRSTGVSMGGLSNSREEAPVHPQLKHLFIDNKYFSEPWHDDEFMTSPPVDENNETWRLKEKMKTSGIALVLCLNIGTDPPDIVKPTPCARRECWFDPISVPKQKGLEVIGNALQQQYEKWQSKAKSKQSLDPTSSELERTCVNLRRHTRSDRLLLHYNGHGVPRPTKNGELWVFGKHYTHYMPVNVCELRNWLGDPSMYVLDCSGAGALLPYFTGSPSHPSNPLMRNHSGGSATSSLSPDKPVGDSIASSMQQCIVLAACQAHEMLPIMNPQYPADIFTSCLTTPITIAVRWFILQNPHISSQMSLDISENIPGKDGDRKTPKGELNWIFTAVADTIAWSCLPPALFQKLFRQDLLVASLFRNFLLAKRIMKSLNCTPQSLPALPDCATHPLWQAWDAAVENCVLFVHSQQQKQKQAGSSPSSGVNSPTKVSSTGNTSAKTSFATGVDSKGGPQGLGVGTQNFMHSSARVHNVPPSNGVVPCPANFGKQGPPPSLDPNFASGAGRNNQMLSSRQQLQQEQKQLRAGVPPFNVDPSGQQPHFGGVTTKTSNRNAPVLGRSASNAPPSTSTSTASASASASFFSEQMTAFEIWLDFGGAGGSYVESNKPPICLPILLQALLSHAHRLKALHLLRRYVALGSKAVHSILAVGNYPYILKLLHNPVSEIRHVLMSIWTYVIGFDRSCREELVKDMKDKNKSQFLQCLQNSDTPHQQRTMAAFILSEMCHQYKPGQEVSLGLGMHKTYISLLTTPEVGRYPHLKKWLTFCLAKLCEDMPLCKAQCIVDEVQLYLYPLLLDSHPFVRSAALCALGELFGASRVVYPQELPEGKMLNKEQWDIRGKEVEIAMQIAESFLDGCATVRREAIVAISKMVMLPIHFECLKHVATAIFEFTRETSFYPNGYLPSADLKRKDVNVGTSSERGRFARKGGDQNIFTPSATDSTVSESDVKSLGKLDADEQSVKSKFSLSSPLRPLLSKNNPESSSFFKKVQARVDSPRGTSTPPPSSTRPSADSGRKFSRSNSCSHEQTGETKSSYLSQSEHTTVLIRSVQDLIETRMDHTHVLESSSSIPQSKPKSKSVLFPSGQSPPPDITRSDDNNGYSIGVGSEDLDSQLQSTSRSGRNPIMSSPNNRSYQQQFRNLQQPHSRMQSPPVLTTSQLSLQMASSYVHLWLLLTEIQNNDPHPVIANTVGALFMHMKVEVAKEAFQKSTTGNNNDHTAEENATTSPSESSNSHRGKVEGKERSHESGSYESYSSGNRPMSTPNAKRLLKIADGPGPEYGRSCIGQDKVLVSTVYDWNRKYFLKPDIGYDPYEDLLSEVGKERSLRMLLREEVKSLSNRIAANFRPIRDDGVYGMFDGESFDHDTVEVGGVKRLSARESNLTQRSRAASGQEEDGMNAGLLPSSLTKFESKGIIKIEHADLSTANLMFHAFHDILAISDNQGVGIWSLESGNRILRINSSTHLSTLCPKFENSGVGGGVTHGPTSPMRYQHHPLRNLPFRNNLRHNLGAEGSANSPLGFRPELGASTSAVDLSTVTTTIDNPTVHAGARTDPFKLGNDGNKAGLIPQHEGANAHVTSMHWINESLDTLLMVGTDDGHIRIFRDIGNGIESSLQSETEKGMDSSNRDWYSHDKQTGGEQGIAAKSDHGTGFKLKQEGNHVGESNATSPGVTLAAAFQALPDISPRGVGGSGMIASWQQSSGMLSVGGNSSTIRLWDVSREMNVATFHTGVETCLTCLVSQAALYSPSSIPSSPTRHNSNNLSNLEFSETGAGSSSLAKSWGETVANSVFERDSSESVDGDLRRLECKSADASFAWSFAGFGDGSIGIFDQRVNSYGGKVHTAKEHNTWIVSAHLRADVPEIITGAYSGTVKFWDIRSMRSYKTIETHKAPTTSLAVHNCAPIMATGSSNQFIKIMTLTGDQLCTIRHHKNSFRGQRIGPVAALSFHPIRLVMAAACTDNLVSIYSIQDG